MTHCEKETEAPEPRRILRMIDEMEKPKQELRSYVGGVPVVLAEFDLQGTNL